MKKTKYKPRPRGRSRRGSRRTDAPTTSPPTTAPPTTAPPTTPSPTTPPPDEKKTAPLCEVFDPNKPTVILKDWFEGPENQHVQIETLNCLIGMDYLAKMPIKINCILEGC